jgi:hypothetical protein
MRYALIAIILTAMAVLLVSEADPAKGPSVLDPAYQVQGLSVKDIDLDDGSGLLVSWTPLPKDKQVIEYRIYRGVSPDSLFQVGSIPVNAKMGVISKELVFFDKDFTEFVSINSPAHLHKEKNQVKGSPLYKKMPRDMSVYAPMLKYYQPLAVINKNEFYFRSKEITKTEPNKTDKSAPADTTTFAGLKLYQFEIILTELKPGQKYYYAIATVDARGKVHSPSKLCDGTPYDNPPAKISPFHAVEVDDAAGKPEKLQFEWEQQLFKDDIAFHSVYALKKQDSLAFAAYLDYQKKHEAWAMANSLLPQPLPDSIQPVPNPAQLVWRSVTSYPYDSPNFAQVTLNNGRVVNREHGIDFTYDPTNQYSFMFSLADNGGFETFSDPVAIDPTPESALPKLPAYEVVDKKGDQGDYMQVNFGQPLAYVSKTSFGSSRQKLVVNYDYAADDRYRIDNIFFTFYNKGQKLAEVNEYYLDRIIKVNLPTVNMDKDSIEVRISFRTGKTQVDPGYELRQWLYFDPETQQMVPTNLYNGKEDVETCRYYVLKRNHNSAQQRLAKRVGSLLRTYNDNIMYETSIFSGIDDFDYKKNLLLVSPMTGLGYSDADSMSLMTSVYPVQLNRELRSYEKEIKKLQDSLAKVTDPAVTAMLQEGIKSYQKFIDVQRNNSQQKLLAAEKNLHKRNKLLRTLREANIRTFAYQFIKSDGKGHFTMSDIYRDAKNESFFMPKSEVYDKTGTPMLIATILFGALVLLYIYRARKGHNLYIRPISGLSEVDNAIGRATEMGRPILFVPGLSSIDDVATLASLAILGHVARKVASYDSRLLVPSCDVIVLPIAQEIVRTAYYEMGRPDAFNMQDIFFTASGQFPYVAAVNGIMIREKTATNFYMGMFYAEALIMTETGSSTGAIQIAGTDAITQIPFFITTCDYTLIGEELYAASAYLSREPLILGTLKAQDYAKLMIVITIVLGTILSTAHLTFFINAFPEK